MEIVNFVGTFEEAAGGACGRRKRLLHLELQAAQKERPASHRRQPGHPSDGVGGIVTR
jgi:hypothetical protein